MKQKFYLTQKRRTLIGAAVDAYVAKRTASGFSTGTGHIAFRMHCGAISRYAAAYVREHGEMPTGAHLVHGRNSHDFGPSSPPAAPKIATPAAAGSSPLPMASRRP